MQEIGRMTDATEPTFGPRPQHLSEDEKDAAIRRGTAIAAKARRATEPSAEAMRIAGDLTTDLRQQFRIAHAIERAKAAARAQAANAASWAIHDTALPASREGNLDMRSRIATEV